MQRGVSLGKHFLCRKSGSVFEESARWRIALSRGADGTAFDIRAGEEALRATLTWQGAYARVAFDDGETIESTWHAADATLIDADGVPLAWMDGIFISVNGESLPVSRTALANALCRIDTDHTEARGSLCLLRAQRSTRSARPRFSGRTQCISLECAGAMKRPSFPTRDDLPSRPAALQRCSQRR